MSAWFRSYFAIYHLGVEVILPYTALVQKLFCHIPYTALVQKLFCHIPYTTLVQKLFCHIPPWFRSYFAIYHLGSEVILPYTTLVQKLFCHIPPWFRSYFAIYHLGSEVILPYTASLACGKDIHLKRDTPGYCSHFRRGSFPRLIPTIGAPVATLPGAWRCRVSAGIGQPSVSIL